MTFAILGEMYTVPGPHQYLSAVILAYALAASHWGGIPSSCTSTVT